LYSVGGRVCGGSAMLVVGYAVYDRGV